HPWQGGDGVRRLQRTEDPLAASARLERLQRFRVGRREIGEASLVAQVRQLGSDPGIVEARADRVGLGDLALFRLQYIRARPVQDAGAALRERGAMLAALQPVPGRLD